VLLDVGSLQDLVLPILLNGGDIALSEKLDRQKVLKIYSMADIVDVVDLTARQQPVQPQTTSGADVIYLDLTQEQIALVQHEYGSGCAGPEKGEGIGYDREYQAKKSRPLVRTLRSFVLSLACSIESSVCIEAQYTLL
jgi:hypothetical protein